MTQRGSASMLRQKRQYGGEAAAPTAAPTTTQGTTPAPAAAYGGSAATGGESGSQGSAASETGQCKCAQQASKCPPGKEEWFLRMEIDFFWYLRDKS